MFVDNELAATERRLFRGMWITVAVGGVCSLFIAPQRVTMGLVLGGVLSLFSYHWLRTGITSAFASAASGAKPSIKILRYISRYFVLAAIILTACLLDVASLTAMLIGLCSFVVAALAEAFMQICFAILHRREIN